MQLGRLEGRQGNGWGLGRGHRCIETAATAGGQPIQPRPVSSCGMCAPHGQHFPHAGRQLCQQRRRQLPRAACAVGQHCSGAGQGRQANHQLPPFPTPPAVGWETAAPPPPLPPAEKVPPPILQLPQPPLTHIPPATHLYTPTPTSTPTSTHIRPSVTHPPRPAGCTPS